MTVAFRYILAAGLLLASLSNVKAAEPGSTARKSFPDRVFLGKGEMTAGIGFLSANLNSDNSQFLLVANNLDFEGRLFHIAPTFSYSYRDNAAIGLRLSYNSLSADVANAYFRLFSDELSAGISDLNLSCRTIGAAVFHRSYSGLDDNGTVGLFCEFQLGYSHAAIGTAPGEENSLNRLSLSFSPGVMLFILPMVSVELSVGMADISCLLSSSPDDGGRLGGLNGGVSLNVLNSRFGISYHF